MTTNSLPRIQVSDNGRFLVTENGDPFFWLGDTAWELFHRLNRDEARLYFQNRQAKRFNVVQAVILAELDGLNIPNTYGECPLHDNDPTRPNEAYFTYVDELIQMATVHELYIGLLPTWGDKVTPMWGIGPQVFTKENAYLYGRFLGERYRDQTNIIWILGGDRPAVNDDADFRSLWQAMAAGIDEGTGGRTLKTYHPHGGFSTSAWLHQEEWLDFNLMQSGHGSGRDTPVWEKIEHDYHLQPIKPTLDGEPNYEDHPVNPWPQWNPANGYYRDYDVRKQTYRSVFAGGCGVTYGHHFIWQMYDQGREPKNNGTEFIPWPQAIDRPGAGQMQYLRALLESRPFLTRIPDQSIIVSKAGEKAEHIRATRDGEGSYAFIYLPTARPVTVKLDFISGENVRAWWCNPRSGQADPIGAYPANGAQEFAPPAGGPDWVLVLDNVARNFAAPGKS